jgi:hypothetical protein
MKKSNAILAMLVICMFAATALPAVSAAPTVMSSVDDATTYVFASYNYTAADVSNIFGLSMSDTDTLYVWYYVGTTLTKATITPTVDAKDIVWFNVDITNGNPTNRQAFFSDTDETDPVADATEALFINASYSDKDIMYIVTIPDGVTFTYDKYNYVFDTDTFAVTNAKDDDEGNITSFEYFVTTGVYATNLSDDTTSHQLVIVSKDGLHGKTAVPVTAKGIDKVNLKPWYLGGATLSTKTTYTMTKETTTEYAIYTSEDGKVAFNVQKDTGIISKYLGGKTEFKMTATDFQYNAKPWWKIWVTSEWTNVPTHATTVDGIQVGQIEKIYLSEKTGEEKHNEILRENYGVLCSRGVPTTASGLDIVTKGFTETPDAFVDTGTTVF